MTDDEDCAGMDEHEDADYTLRQSLHGDGCRCRNAIRGALVKMQRGHKLLAQATEKLEILLESPLARESDAGHCTNDVLQPVQNAKSKEEKNTSYMSEQSCSSSNCGNAEKTSVTRQRPPMIMEALESGEKTSVPRHRPSIMEDDEPGPSPGMANSSSYDSRSPGPYHSQSPGKSSFITSLSTASVDDTPSRVFVRNFLENLTVQMVSVSLILFTVLLICFDTDARAKGVSVNPWVDILMFVCFLAYALEFFATIYVERTKAIWSHWNYIDGFVIVSSSIDYLVALLASGDGLITLRLLRICRLLRLGRVIRALRLLRSVKSLKEQYLLLTMMASCVRTVGWAFLLCFFILTVWSILAVEFLNEIVVKLDTTTSIWNDCDRCGRSFSSIWNATLTFFQTIVAGDSWGKVAVPVIEDSWWSVLIFMGALSTVIFGVLNMISVVVIDTFAERRAKDLTHVATELEYEEIEERRQLGKIFRQIDEDRNGGLSVEELQKGAKKVKAFSQYLRVLDIDNKDLVDLFEYLDSDGSGEVDPDEFIDALYRMKATESKTTTRFLKHMVVSLLDKADLLEQRLESTHSHVSRKLDDVEKKIRLEIEERPDDEEIQSILEHHADEINTTVARAIDKAVSVALETAVASAQTTASHAIKEVVTSSSNQVAAMSCRLAKSRRRDAPHTSLVSPSSLQACLPPLTAVDTGLYRASKHDASLGEPIVISASSKAPPPTEWFD